MPLGSYGLASNPQRFLHSPNTHLSQELFLKIISGATKQQYVKAKIPKNIIAAREGCSFPDAFRRKKDSQYHRIYPQIPRNLPTQLESLAITVTFPVSVFSKKNISISSSVHLHLRLFWLCFWKYILDLVRGGVPKMKTAAVPQS